MSEFSNKDRKAVTSIRNESDLALQTGTTWGVDRWLKMAARNKKRAKRILARHPEQQPVPGWTWEQRIHYVGPWRQGGWLRLNQPDDQYHTGPLYLGFDNPVIREALRSRLKLAGATHAVVIMRSTKPGFSPSFDGYADLDDTRAKLQELVDDGLIPVVFGGSDYDHKQDHTLINKFHTAVITLGIDLVGIACPGIEMDEWSGPGNWEEWAATWFHEGTIPLAYHFGQERYFNRGQDLIMWQDKDIGHDGVTVRGPQARRHYHLDRTVRPYSDDRYYGSPMLSAKKDGIAYVYFEYGVPHNFGFDAAYCTRIAEAVRGAMSQESMPERIG